MSGPRPAFQRHPLSELFGDMPEDQYAELVESIRDHGIASPLITAVERDGTMCVIDGWHHYRTAIECEREDELFPAPHGGDAKDLVRAALSANKHRRHLSSVDLADITERAAVVELQHQADRARDWTLVDLCARALRGHSDAACSITTALEALRTAYRPVTARHNRPKPPSRDFMGLAP